MLKQSMQDVNKAATLTALSARPAMLSAPDIATGGHFKRPREEGAVFTSQEVAANVE